MRNLIWICALMLCTHISKAEMIEFHQGDLQSAIETAKKEGKHVLVDFYANWCAPCKYMAETTFRDPRVVNLIKEKYIAVKIDIDQVDGYNTKQKYEVRYLPTLLVFNHQGKMVNRVEETLGINKMLNFLGDTGEKTIVKKINASPRQNNNYSPTETKSLYRVQVGSYTDFKGTFDLVNSLKAQFLEPILVLNDYRNGQTYYNVVIGEFKSKSEADSFAVILKNDFDMDAIVK